MTDIQLKKRLKKLSVLLIFLMLAIVLLSVYTLGFGKAELSLYTSAESQDKLQALGIGEDEFKQYLSIAGYMIQIDSDEKMLNMATDFIDMLCSAYEAEVGEDGTKSYDMEIIKNVSEEMIGTYFKGTIQDNEYYQYHAETNMCTSIKESDEKPFCVKIKDVSKNDDKIEVTYELAVVTSEQMAEYSTNGKLDLDTQTVKAVIICNSDYEYSKYFISEVEVDD